MTREEAIKKVRWGLLGLAIDKDVRDAFKTLIPELRESEDERIRKEIKQFILDTIGEISFDDKENAWLEWLEKQKEKMTAEEFESSELFQLKLKTKYANGYQDGLAQQEQKPINQCNTHEPSLDEAMKWNEAYDKMYSRYCKLLHNKLNNK